MSNKFEDCRSNLADAEWQFWCRLCTKDDIQRNEDLPHWLCVQCFSLVSSLSKFTKQVNKVQSMYNEIQSSDHRKAKDFRVIRDKYNLVQYEFVMFNMSDTKSSIENIFVADAPEIVIHNSLDNIVKSEIISDELQSGILLNEGEYNSEFQDPIGDVIENSTIDVKSNNSFNNSIDDSESEQNEKECKKLNRIKKQPNSLDEESKSDKYFCDECSLHFKRSSNYGIHMKKKHGIVIERDTCFSCPQCSRSFKYKFKLNRHIKIHRPLTEKRIFPCPQCDRKFQTKDYVFRHIKFVHEDIRPFICEECGECTRTETTLREHMLIHTDYAPYECEICKKGFKNQSRLKKHMEMHSSHKHICSECGLELNSRLTLNRHMRHKCDYCGREFKRAKTLKTHLILHSGLKPYLCDFCDKTFANGSNCRTHKRKSHPEELAALEASGEKKFTKNIPKLAVLKTVTRTAENLLPVVSKQSGNFSFGRKPKPPTSGKAKQNNNKNEAQKCAENT
ncbi:zinc finger protein weckle isoform X2 [Bactrocera oleae]|uniref:zinc finger protein weckle isoform X2 n=1 Tax=Bactrocera oleae TaxID=104688 RepID=UPI00387EC8EF